MKKLFLFVLSVSIISIYTSYAQLTPKEKKALQKTMLGKTKAMDPEDLEEMYNEYPAMKGKVASLEKKNEKLEADLMASKEKNVEFETKLAALEAENVAFKDQALNSGGASDGGEGSSQGGSNTQGMSTISTKGVVYKVQIGAFKNKDLSKYFKNNPNFGGEVDSDGTQKYSIGVFKDYWEADTFKKYMRQMGVKDAWVVAYKDGERISMKDAREGSGAK